LTALTKGRTTFVIAHNFETIVHADQILVLDEGQVVQQGTHAVLLRISPRYRELYELQFGVQASPLAQATPEAPPEATPAPLLQPMIAGTP
jgi:ABC-type multidrug transport system ATPase subunit